MQALNLSLEAMVAPAREGPIAGILFCAARGDNDFASCLGSSSPVRVHLNNPGAAALTLNRVWLETPAGESWSTQRRIPPFPRSWAPARRSTSASPYARRKMRRRRVPISRGPTKSCLITTKSTNATAIFRLLLIRWRPGLNSPIWACRCASARWCRRCNSRPAKASVLNPLVVTPAVSVRIFPGGRHHAAGLEIIRALRASAYRSGSGRERHGAARSARRLALRAGVGSLRAGARGPGTDRALRGDCRSPGDKAIHGDSGGGVRRTAISRRLHHRGVSRACAPTIFMCRRPIAPPAWT